MKKIIFCFIFSLILFSISPEEIRAALPDVPGSLFRNERGEPAGFYLDLVEALLEKLEVQIIWVDGNWSDMLEQVESGDLDLLPIAGVTEKRRDTLDFLETPVITTWSELYTKSRSDFKKITDLEGKEIGLVNGDHNSTAFTLYIRNFGINYTPILFSDHAQAVRALINGEIYAVAGPSDLATEYSGQISGTRVYFNAVNSTLAFHKGYNRDLQTRIDHLLMQWKSDKKSPYYQLLKEYSMMETSSIALPRWFWPLIFSIIGIISLSLGFNFLLRYRVRMQTQKNLDTEKRLEQSQKMEAVGQLAGGVAHDFNNMLTGIMGYAELLLPSLKEEKQIEYCRQILDSSLQAADLTEQLLSFARKNPTHKRSVDLHDILLASEKLLLPSLDSRIELLKNFEAGDSLIEGDRTQLQNVFLNLGLNARDAMPRGGKLKILTENQYLSKEYISDNKGTDWKPGYYILVRFIDTGSGMNDELMSHIYEPFFTTKEVGKGTGLGLPAVLGTIKSHSGGICVDSSPGKGTEFIVYLPLLNQERTT